MSFLVWARETGVRAVGWRDAAEVAGDGDGSGGLTDPLTTPINLATTDASKVPLKITLPAGFDMGAYDAIEIEDSDGLRLLSFDVGGGLYIFANPALSSPTVALATDGSTANITLHQGSDTVGTEIIARPGAGQSATVQVTNADATPEHTLTSAPTQGSGLVGFYGHTSVALQQGVAVDAAGIHAALVNLGLITA